MQPNNCEGPVNISRCLDQELIATILRRDYFDDPVPHLSPRVIKTFARSWIASRSQVYLLTAEADGTYAGFVFGHTLGPRFWRRFATHHPNLLPPLVWASLKMKFAAKKKLSEAKTLPNPPAGDDLESEIAALEISTIPQPFAWAPEGSGAGLIPLLFVDPVHRGKGVASHLLNQLSDEMFRDGAKIVEAHIDLQNFSSVRAFLKAGFEVYRMATNDFWARKVKPD
ncbi:MAG: GNAT family N-acetyltransferase [Pyrinomonadaceae bacterium]